MTQPYNLTIGVSYRIFLHAAAILGEKYENATLKGLLDYDSACTIQDVDQIHASVLPLLPNGTPASARDQTYAKIRTVNGEIRVLALSWITVQPTPISSQTATVVVQDCPPSRKAELAAVLKANGFSQFQIQ